MPRPEADRAVVDEMLSNLPEPEKQFAEQIAAEIDRIEGIMAKADRDRAKTGYQIAVLASNREDISGYIADFASHSAVLAVFERRGVLEGYYGSDPTIGRNRFTGNDWLIELLPPEGEGWFKVEHQTYERKGSPEQKGATFSRQTITYFARRRKDQR